MGSRESEAEQIPSSPARPRAGKSGLRGEGATAIVLAGGQSSRFGSDKAAALLLGRPLLQWVVEAVSGVAAEVVVVAARGQSLPGVTCIVPGRVVRDDYDAQGPLAGLVTGLEAATHDICLGVSCDAPFLQPALLGYLAANVGAAAALLPKVGGQLQPLAAAYRKAACLEAFRDRIEAGELGLTAAAALVRPGIIEESEVRRLDPELRSFRQANTATELERLATELASRIQNPNIQMA